MKKFFIFVLILCFPFTAHAWIGKVVSVTDGDTIKVFNAEQGQVKIRLYGIDTPERGQPYGKAAGKYLAFLIAGAIVDIETVTMDHYGRTVGIVTDGVKNINQEMVRSGYAWVYRRYCEKSFCDFWLVLEEEAKANKFGLWQEPEPIQPWKWRRRK